MKFRPRQRVDELGRVRVNDKRDRTEKATLEAQKRMQKHLLSLHHCLVRSDVMRHHHDALVQEMTEADDLQTFTDVKKARFSAYLAFWFTGLVGVIERYEQLRDKKAIPPSPEIDRLLSESFKDVLKPFRNSVAHCSDHDDQRTLNLFGHVDTIPDRAAEIAQAFHTYFKKHRVNNA